MKTESTIRPKNNFIIEKRDNTCEVVFFDDIKEETRIREIDDETLTETMYTYNTFKISVLFRETLEEDIKNNFNIWLDFAKNKNIEDKASEVRAIRNQLLAESDKEMALDRLNIEMPKTLNATNLLSVVKGFFETLSEIKNSDWARYRQELRDLTKQEGFPYNVSFPKKPNE